LGFPVTLGGEAVHGVIRFRVTDEVESHGGPYLKKTKDVQTRKPEKSVEPPLKQSSSLRSNTLQGMQVHQVY
jgi:hypothetical protein